jgi:xanthosine utilization system XapX-like protein
LDLIRPRIEGFQGALTPEEAQVPADQFPSHPLPTRADAVPRDERPFPAYRGGAHLAAFSLLIGEAVLGFASLRFHDRLFLIVSGLLTLALFACLVTAVVKQHASPVPRLAGGLVWVAIGGLAIVITCGYYVGIILNAMNVRGNARPEMDMTGIVSVILSRPLFPYVAVVCSVCMAAVGTLGLLACLRGRGTPGVALPENADPLARDSVP